MVKIQIIEKLLPYILIFSYLLLPLAFIIGKTKRNTVLAVLLIYGIIIFLLLFYWFDFPKNYRKLQQAVFTFLEYATFTCIFYNAITQRKIKNTILILSGLFICFHIAFFMTSVQGKIDSVPVGVETILILCYTFLYFQDFLKHGRTLYVYNDPNFLFVVGILIYLCSSFFFNILANHLTQQEIELYWKLTYLPDIVKNILFAIAMYRFSSGVNNEKRLKSSHIPNLDMI